MGCSGFVWLVDAVGQYVQLVCGLQAFSYGFANGLMASRVAQFGGAARVALAAGGMARARPRAGPSHCAHVQASGWRQRLVGT
jgi:hypothetical protein